jgi:ketosteroid isomerase-like protein
MTDAGGDRVVDPAADRAAVAERSAAWQRALEARDVVGVDDFLDPDYALVLVHPAPVTVPRAAWLGMLPDYVVHSWTVTDAVTDVAGDVAMVLQSGEQQATVRGADRSGRFVISDCWRRGADGAWRVWRRHSTPLQAGPMPSA